MFTRDPAALARRLLDHVSDLDGEGAGMVEKLIVEVHEAAAHNVRGLDESPHLKMGVVFMLQGTAKALATKRAVRSCIDRKLTDEEERLLEESAMSLSRAALALSKL